MTAEFLLRPATADDQLFIKDMVRFARLNPVGLKWQRFIIAVDTKDTIIGCGQIKRHIDGSLELASLVVRKPWRRQGVARSIINKLLADNELPVWLTCASPLIPFYSKFGFQEKTTSKEMPFYFGMVKYLSRIFLILFPNQYYLAVMVRKA